VIWQNAVVLRFYKNILFLISISCSLLRNFNRKKYLSLPLLPKSVCFVTYWLNMRPWHHLKKMYFLLAATKFYRQKLKNLALHVVIVVNARCWVLWVVHKWHQTILRKNNTLPIYHIRSQCSEPHQIWSDKLLPPLPAALVYHTRMSFSASKLSWVALERGAGEAASPLCPCSPRKILMVTKCPLLTIRMPMCDILNVIFARQHWYQ